jgi:hypothetical protein
MASRRFRFRGKQGASPDGQPGPGDVNTENNYNAPARGNTANTVNVRNAAPRQQSSDPVADDLMRRVVKAIDDWIIDNGLTALPRNIAFQQALSILNALDRVYADRHTK